MYSDMKKIKNNKRNESLERAIVTLPYNDFLHMCDNRKTGKRKPYKTECKSNAHGRIDSWRSGACTITIPATHEQLMYASPDFFADKCKVLLMDYREEHRQGPWQPSLFDDFLTDPAA